jgi:hypothetical protein
MRTRPHLSSIVALGTLFATLWGCGLNKFKESVEDTATIPGTTTLMQPFALGYMGGFNSLNLSQSKGFQNAGVTPSNVDAIFVESVHLEAMNPGVDDFGAILASVTLWVVAPSVQKATIATQTGFPAGSSSADLMVVPNLNIKPFAVQPMMQVGADVVLKQHPAFNTTITTTVNLLVDIHLP